MKNHLPLSLIALITALLISGCFKPLLPQLNHDDTIAGPDTDNNGIRDDIDAYIATLPYTEVQKKAVQQDARALNGILIVDKADQAAVIVANEKLTRSIGCLHFQLDSDGASKMFADNQKMIVNTKIRFIEYEKFNSALSGMSWTLLERETSCDK
jgi:hypothetical protein